MLLKDKVALITGASRGIGRAMAVGFAGEGANLVLCARHGDGAQKLADEIQQTGRQALAVQADVSSESDVQTLVDRAIERFGRIDVLHNNAGILLQHSIVEHPVDTWDETMAINIRGTFLCCRAVLPHMTAQGYGRIINMTSILSDLCIPGYGSYAVSKAAVNAMTRTLAKEFSGRDILINGQHPGNITTEMNPSGTHPPDHAVPTAIYLASLPADGPTGRFFYDMKEVDWA